MKFGERCAHGSFLLFSYAAVGAFTTEPYGQVGSDTCGANAVSAEFDCVERRRSHYHAAGLIFWDNPRVPYAAVGV